MTPDLFRELRRKGKAFIVHTTDGRKYGVSDPCFAALGHDRVSMLVPNDDGWFDVIRLNQIESINVVDESAA